MYSGTVELTKTRDVILACEGKQTIIQHVLSGLVRSPIIEEVLKLHKKVICLSPSPLTL